MDDTDKTRHRGLYEIPFADGTLLKANTEYRVVVETETETGLQFARAIPVWGQEKGESMISDDDIPVGPYCRNFNHPAYDKSFIKAGHEFRQAVLELGRALSEVWPFTYVGRFKNWLARKLNNPTP